MNKSVRKAIGWGVATSFVLSGCRRRRVAAYRTQGTVLSVFGHSPCPKVLDSLLGWLIRKGFNFISTDELLSVRDGTRAWKPQMAWLTFDDGWAGFESNLLPILKKHNVPVTIFVAPNETDRGKIWTNSVIGAVEGWQAWYGMTAEDRYAAVDKVLGGIPNGSPRLDRHLTTRDELCRLAADPLITLENHTYTHLSCSHRPVAEVMDEVKKTQNILLEWTGRTPRLVCYPFGHCTAETDAEIRSLGLIPVKSFPGQMALDTIGEYRNMFHDVMGLYENVGRVLQAWPRVKVHMA